MLQCRYCHNIIQLRVSKLSYCARVRVTLTLEVLPTGKIRQLVAGVDFANLKGGKVDINTLEQMVIADVLLSLHRPYQLTVSSLGRQFFTSSPLPNPTLSANISPPAEPSAASPATFRYQQAHLSSVR